MSSEEAFAALGSEEVVAVILAGLAAYSVVALIWLILRIIANWKIFEKAGEKGWKSLIPFYSDYVTFKISWSTVMFWVMLVCVFLGAFLRSMAGEENGGLLATIGSIITLVGVAITIIDIHKLSRSFGHDIPFTLGLIFLNPIFKLILAFGSSKYIGPNGIPKEYPPVGDNPPQS